MAEKKIIISVIGFVAVTAAAVFSFSYFGKAQTPLRNAIPKDSLAYVEVRDAGKIYEQLLRNAESPEAGAYDFLDGVRIGIAVTGLKASEEAVTSDASIVNVQPEFVSVIETNAWSWQINGVLDGPVHDLISSRYGEGVKRSTYSGNFGKVVKWRASDEDLAFAAISGSRIVLGNSREALESTLEGLNGKADVGKVFGETLDERLDLNPEAMIVGYFPKTAIESFAEVVGVSAAVSGTENEGFRKFIARVLPSVLRSTAEEITWTTRIVDGEFTDVVSVYTTKDVREVFSETMKPGAKGADDALDHIPSGFVSASRYRLKRPVLAYRSLLLTAANKADPVTGRLIGAFSSSLLEPYGVSDPERFLKAVKGDILTVQRADDESSVAVMIKDRELIIQSLNSGFTTDPASGRKDSEESWLTLDDWAAVLIESEKLILGEKKSVSASLVTDHSHPSEVWDLIKELKKSDSVAMTITNDGDEYLFGRKRVKGGYYLTETSFPGGNIERSYRSKFGFAGSFVSSFSAD